MIDVEQGGDGIVWITLNRPDKANSLTAQMLQDLLSAVQHANTARAVVLTGAGSKVFSAGADLDEARAGLATSPLWEQVSSAVAALPCLTIAALNGTLAGGAFGMVLACDLRIAVPHAKFFYPVAKLGFLPQPSDPGRMAALIGPARSKLVLLAGAKLTADEAERFGLVDRITAPDALTEEARTLCANACAGNLEILHQIKKLIP